MNQDNITVDLLLNPRQFQAGLAAAQAQGIAAGKSIEDNMASKTNAVEQRFGSLGGKVKVALGIASVAAVVAGGAAIKMAGDFEQSLNVLQSVTGATADQMSQLSARARELGKDATLPGVSARDAAGAMTELAKAGLTVNDVLGASRGVLSLAKAGQLDVADAATITARALNTFGLAGDQASTVADLLAAGANSSTASVTDMAQALAQGGAGARQMGVSVQDTVTALAIFSNAGINASDAGTSLKTMFQRLAAPTDEASTLMKQLGLDFFDAQGHFIGLSATAGQLQAKLGNLTEEQRNQALATLFGADSSRVAGILATQGAAGFDKMAAAVTKTGAATDLARAQTKGWNGVLDNIKSTAETLAIDVGTKLLPVFEVVGTFIASNLTPIIIGLTASVTALGVAYAGAAVSGGALAGVMAVLLSPVTAVVVGVGLLAAGLTVLEQKTGAISASLAILGGMYTAVATSISSNPAFQLLLNVLTTLWGFISTTLIPVLMWVASVLQPYIPLILRIVGAVLAFTTALAFVPLATFATAIIVAATVLGTLLAAFIRIVQGAYNMASGIASAIGRVVSAVAGGISDAVNAVNSFAGRFFDAGRGLVNAIVNGIKSAPGAIVGAIKDMAGEAARFLPFSDAKEGPFSHLTASGRAIPGTLAEGVRANLGALSSAMGAMPSVSSLGASFGDPIGGNVSVSATGDYSGGGGGAGTVINQYNTIQNELDMDRVNRDLGWQMRTA